MNNPRQKKQLIILVGLLVVLVVVFYQAMDSSFPPDVPKVGTISSSTTFDELDGYIFKIGQGKDRREQRLIPASEINPVIHFRKLKQIEPVEPSFSRNMFSFYTPPPNRKTTRMSRPSSPKASKSIVIRKKLEDPINLRFYGFIQYFPILLLPILCKFFPNWRHTNGKYLFWIVVCYGFAVLLEQLDHWLYGLSSDLISGHTLKHLFAALAAFWVIRMITSSKSE